MSGLEDLLGSALGGGAVSTIAKQLGLSDDVTHGAIGAALPLLLGQLKDNADDPDKGPMLNNAIDNDHDGSALSDVNGLVGGGLAEAVGAKILGHVFGQQQSQHQAATQASSKIGGIDTATMLRLLAILAPIVLGAMGKAKRQGTSTAASSAGGLDLGSILGGVLGNAGGAGGLGAVLGGLLGGGGGGLGSVLGGASSAGAAASSNAGNIVEDVLAGATGKGGKGAGGMLGKVLGGFLRKK